MHQGTGILVKKNISAYKGTLFQHKNKNITHLSLNIDPDNVINLISIYVPPNSEKSEEARYEAIGDMLDLMEKIPSQEKICGYFDINTDLRNLSVGEKKERRSLESRYLDIIFK